MYGKNRTGYSDTEVVNDRWSTMSSLDVDLEPYMTKSSNYKSKLLYFKGRLGSLLEQKKVFLSKVVSKEFDHFCLAVEMVANGNGSPDDVTYTLTQLERSLKKEGLYKNVKSGFVTIKRDFLEVSPPPPPKPEAERGKPTIVAKQNHHNSREHNPPKTREQNHHTTREQPRRLRNHGNSDTEDIKNLNRAVGRLFDHLNIQRSPDRDHDAVSSHSHAPQRHHDGEEFQELVMKLKTFEREFQKQKATQHTELIRLLEENRTLKSSMNDLKKENHKLKSVQPIASKAANKQVEKIERHFQTQRRGMEGKIQEIEVELQSNLQSTIQEKDALEQVILDGVTKLKLCITTLHNKLFGRRQRKGADREESSVFHYDFSHVKMEDLIKDMTDIEQEALDLQERNEHLQRAIKEKDEEIRELKTAFSQLTREVAQIHYSVSDVGGNTRIQPDESRDGDDSTLGVSLSEVKLRRAFETDGTGAVAAEKDVAIDKLKQVNLTIQQYKRTIQNEHPRADLQPLKSEINRIHDDLMSTMRPGSVVRSRAESIIGKSVKGETTRSRTDELNQLLQKLSRIERACEDVLKRYSPLDKADGVGRWTGDV